MSEIIHSTTVHTPGPWLIEREKLKELDKLFEAEWQKLLKRRESLINEGLKKFILDNRKVLGDAGLEKINAKNAALAKTFQDLVVIPDGYRYRLERSMVIFLKGHRRINVDTLDDAFRETALLNECPIGLELIMKVCDVKLDLSVINNENYSYLNGAYLFLKVEPDTDDTAKGLFALFKTWVDTCKPPLWQTLWMQCQFLCLMSALCSGMIMSTLSFTHNWSHLQSRYGILLVGAFVFAVFLCFIPNVIVGIGKGDSAIKNWKKWMTFLGIGTPVYIIGTFITPPIIERIKTLFQ